MSYGEDSCLDRIFVSHYDRDDNIISTEQKRNNRNELFRDNAKRDIGIKPRLLMYVGYLVTVHD